MSTAAVLESDPGDVELTDRVERREDVCPLDAVDETPFGAETRSVGDLVADLAAVGRGVDGLDPPRAEGDRARVLEASLDLHPIRAQDRLALASELVDRAIGESVPGLEVVGVRRERCVHGIRRRQPPVPEILVFDVLEQGGDFFAGMKVLPGEDRARMSEIEMQLVAVGLEGREPGRLAQEPLLRGHMVVEDDDLVGDLRQLPQLFACRGDVDEGDEGVFAVRESYAVFVTPGDIAPGVAPGAVDGPDGAESIGTTGMIEADAFHGLSIRSRGEGRGSVAAGGRFVTRTGPCDSLLAFDDFRGALEMFKPGERIALAALDRPATPSAWLEIVEGLHAEPGFWWLDSALCDGRLGRFSFAGSDPYLWLRGRGGRVEIDVLRPVRSGLARGSHQLDSDPFDCARSLLPRADSLVFSTRTAIGSGNPNWHEVDGLSSGIELPFVGGAVGYFGYELAAVTLPRVRCENPDDVGLPDLSLAYVDQVLAYDHAAGQLWMVGLGFRSVASSRGESARDDAMASSRAVADRLAARVEALLSSSPRRSGDASSIVDPDGDATEIHPPRGANAAATVASNVSSTVDASGYAKAVDSILEEIEAGNVYQANFSQRLTLSVPIDPWHLYGALRRHNPAPFGAYLALPGAALLSSSPERFLRMDVARRVESRPIKGTRPRGDDDVSDAQLLRELAVSEKDRAENLMIVDLVRNDLGRVCAPGTIAVPELMQIEAYATVFQMVSTVTGELATGRDAFDLVRANFPPGSMTGAPKLAAIALLEELESVRRGVYAGALGYLDLRGGLDLSVVIRTLVWKDGLAHLHVGGGIVADSTPAAEYLESLDKAKAPLAAIDEVVGRGRGERT